MLVVQQDDMYVHVIANAQEGHESIVTYLLAHAPNDWSNWPKKSSPLYPSPSMDNQIMSRKF